MSDFALNPHLAVVQLHATSYEKKAQSGASTASDVGATMKGGKQRLLIVLGNPDSLIANNSYSFIRIALDRKPDAGSRFRIFNRVTQ